MVCAQAPVVLPALHVQGAVQAVLDAPWPRTMISRALVSTDRPGHAVGLTTRASRPGLPRTVPARRLRRPLEGWRLPYRGRQVHVDHSFLPRTSIPRWARASSWRERGRLPTRIPWPRPLMVGARPLSRRSRMVRHVYHSVPQLLEGVWKCSWGRQREPQSKMRFTSTMQLALRAPSHSTWPPLWNANPMTPTCPMPSGSGFAACCPAPARADAPSRCPAAQS